VKKYDIVDDLMDALVSRQNCYAVEDHNMALLNAGLLLVYRIASMGTFHHCIYTLVLRNSADKPTQKRTVPNSHSSNPSLAILSRQYTSLCTTPP
jgi:hypothetical protein